MSVAFGSCSSAARLGTAQAKNGLGSAHGLGSRGAAAGDTRGPEPPVARGPGRHAGGDSRACSGQWRTEPQTTAATVRAALESVAVGVRRTLAELDGLLGRRVSRIHVVGGGVKNALLCQMIADAADRPVVAGPVEATAIGNLLVQLLSTQGTVDLRAIRQVVRDTFDPVYYEPKNAKRWNDRLA